MFKKFLLMSFTAICICLMAGQAVAASEFDGKWYLDLDKMAENDPEFAELKNVPEIWEQIKSEMGKGSIELNSAKGELTDTFSGEKPSTSKITVLSQNEKIMRVQGDGEVFVFTLTGPGTLTMHLEGAEEQGTIYFKR